ncbi:MAG: AarF/ABC1/UbiB kinase family protein [Alphaproteobacteria bacterium]|nr:AarF/ABC1/UbiB kinase family protein [Alphaproteobacteria bacterium]
MAKESRLRRLARMGGLATRVTTEWVGQGVRSALASTETQRQQLRERFQLDSAEQVVEVLGQLRGAAMKVGQGLSIAAQHLDLPDDVRQTLAKLQSEARPVPADQIRATLERELGAPVPEVFRRFDDTPLGTASLAQAHAAVLPDGRKVVVKVLHDGVDDAVQSDLLALRTVMLSGRAFGRSKEELDGVYEEIRARLLEELDYLQEAANIQAFVEAFGDGDGVRIPRHVPALCTERVLVLDHLPGMPLERFLAIATPEARQAAGMNLAHLFLDMAFDKRLLHADPHPGNYLFEADGRVDLLDFGCVKRLDVFWMATYAEAVLHALDGDRDACLDAVRRMGAWDGDDPGAADVIWQFCDTVLAPWRRGDHVIGVDDGDLLEEIKPVVRRIWSYPEIVAPPEVVFLHRTLGGLYTLARRLQVRGRWDAILRHYLDRAIAAGR